MGRASLRSRESRNRNMLPAVDRHGNRIAPTKGGRGICPGCGGEMHAKCGETKVHHWAHVSVKDCDSWSDNRTSPWHMAWQECFPEECREVFVGENNEHRADVKGQKMILEVQKSTISAEKIREREEFYGDMAWMLCGEDFESRFVLHGQSACSFEGFIFFNFTWKNMRTCWLSANKPIFVHFAKGIGLIEELNEDGSGIIEFITMERFAEEIDLRFDPAPVQRSQKGFKPVIKDFTETCIDYENFLENEAEAISWYDIDDQVKTAIKHKSDIDSLCELKNDFTRYLTTAQRESLKEASLSLYKLSRHPDFYAYENELNLFNEGIIERPRSYASNIFCFYSSAAKAFKTFLSTESIEKRKRNTVKKIEEFKPHLDDIGSALSKFQTFESTLADFDGKEGVSAFLSRFYIEIYPRMLKCFNFRLNLILIPALIDHIEVILWPEFISYRLHAYKDSAFPRRGYIYECALPTYEEVKTLFALMRPTYRGELGLAVKSKWAEHQESQRLAQIQRQIEERKKEEAIKRQELYQKQVSEAERQERLSWPIEKVMKSFIDGVDGMAVDKESLAMHVAMFPNSRWADELTVEQLEVATEMLGKFNPVSIWKS